MFIIDPGPTKCNAPQNEYSQLALASFEVFRPYINVYDCGVKLSSGDIVHSISGEAWQLHTRHKAGEKHLSFADGREFKPYQHIVSKIYSAKHVQGHLDHKTITYFTSGRHGKALLYADIDDHDGIYGDERQALAVLRRYLPEMYDRPSFRGQNGYLKMKYGTPAQLNDLADQLQATVRQLLLSEGVLCDFEIKGTVTTKEKSGRLGKLPFWQNDPCDMRNEHDSWCYPELERFQACRELDIATLRRRVALMRASINPDRVAETKAKKVALIQASQKPADEIPVEEALVEVEKVGSKPVPGKNADRPAKAPIAKIVTTDPPVRVPRSSGSLEEEPDSFQRQMAATQELARKLGRVPTSEEQTAFIKLNRLFTGDWEENWAARRSRLAYILRSVAETFDPAKCKSAASLSPQPARFLNLARSIINGKHLPNVRRRVDEYGEITEIQDRTPIDEQYLAASLAMVQQAVAVWGNEDGSIPFKGIKQEWEKAYDRGDISVKFHSRKWGFCLTIMERRGILVCVDPNYCKDKAKRYKILEDLDRLAEWWRTERTQSANEPVVLTDLLSSFTNNSYLTLSCAVTGQVLGFCPDQQTRKPP
jgi:hypothetical protein